MSYIGNSPGVASQRVTTTLTATAGQTQFTTLSGYILGYVDVYLNGAKLVNGVDFESITGTYITLFAAAEVGDVVELVSYVPRGLTDGYTKPEADARFLDITSTVPAARMPALTGDITTTAGTVATTLATVNSNVGAFGSATAIPVITVNAKGLITAVSTTAVTIPSGSISVTGGDITLSGNTGTAITNATLATVNSNVGTFNNVTVNAKGLITAASNVGYVLNTEVTPLKKQEFTATAAQTTFTITGGYTVGSVQVFANGIALAAADFTATNGTTVILTEARNLNDNIIVTSGGVLQPISGGGTTTNALTVGTGLVLNSGTTFDGSVAKTISLQNLAMNGVTGGGSSYINSITTDAYGRVTALTTGTPGGGGNAFGTLYVNGSFAYGASGTDSLNIVGSGATTVAYSSGVYPTLTISSTASAGGGGALTWSTTTSAGYQGSTSITYPSGATTSGNKLYVAFYGGSSINSGWISTPSIISGVTWNMVISMSGWVIYSADTSSSLPASQSWQFNNMGHMIYTSWVVTGATTSTAISNMSSNSTFSYYLSSMYNKTDTVLIGSDSVNVTTATITPPSGYSSAGSKTHPSMAMYVIAYQNPTPTVNMTQNWSINNSFSTYYYAYVNVG